MRKAIAIALVGACALCRRLEGRRSAMLPVLETQKVKAAMELPPL